MGCFLFDLNEYHLYRHEYLNIPDDYMIPCFIGVGRPAETAVYTKQIDVDYDTQIHWEMF